MMPKPIEEGRQDRRYELIVLFTALAIIAASVPLQRFINLARFQHYAISVTLFGAGYLIQALLSWNKLLKWGKISYLITGAFCLSIAVIFWLNPWLDFKVSVSTEEKDHLRSTFFMAYAFTAPLVVLAWIKWAVDDHKYKKSLKQSHGAGGGA